MSRHNPIIKTNLLLIQHFIIILEQQTWTHDKPIFQVMVSAQV